MDPREIKCIRLASYTSDHTVFALRLLEKTGTELVVHENAFNFQERGMLYYSAHA